MSTDRFIMPSPKGAYFLTKDNRSSWQKDVLKRLFGFEESPKLNSDTLKSIFNSPKLTTASAVNDLKQKIKLFQQLQLVDIFAKSLQAPSLQLENNLNNLFQSFTSKQKVLLSDSQGFCIASHGFPVDMNEEISVLSADIAIMHKRRAKLVIEKLQLNFHAWSIVDSMGKSRLGFWPINIDNEVFVLTIQGEPFFNNKLFTSLVWMLHLKYGNK